MTSSTAAAASRAALGFEELRLAQPARSQFSLLTWSDGAQRGSLGE
jgi:hypothetical protein